MCLIEVVVDFFSVNLCCGSPAGLFVATLLTSVDLLCCTLLLFSTLAVDTTCKLLLTCFLSVCFVELMLLEMFTGPWLPLVLSHWMLAFNLMPCSATLSTSPLQIMKVLDALVDVDATMSLQLVSLPSHSDHGGKITDKSGFTFHFFLGPLRKPAFSLSSLLTTKVDLLSYQTQTHIYARYKGLLSIYRVIKWSRSG